MFAEIPKLINELMKMSINKNPMSYNQYKGLNSEEKESQKEKQYF